MCQKAAGSSASDEEEETDEVDESDGTPAQWKKDADSGVPWGEDGAKRFKSDVWETHSHLFWKFLMREARAQNEGLRSKKVLSKGVHIPTRMDADHPFTRSAAFGSVVAVGGMSIVLLPKHFIDPSTGLPVLLQTWLFTSKQRENSRKKSAKWAINIPKNCAVVRVAPSSDQPVDWSAYKFPKDVSQTKILWADRTPDPLIQVLNWCSDQDPLSSTCTVTTFGVMDAYKAFLRNVISDFKFEPLSKKPGEGRVDGNYWMYETDAQMHDLPQMFITVNVSDLIMDTKSNLADGKNNLNKKVPLRWHYPTMHTEEGEKEALVMMKDNTAWRDRLLGRGEASAETMVIFNPILDAKKCRDAIPSSVVKARVSTTELNWTEKEQADVQKSIEADKQKSGAKKKLDMSKAEQGQ